MLKIYNKATNLQRFIAYIIDFIIILAITSGISALILLPMNFDYRNFVSARQELVQDLLLQATFGGNYSKTFGTTLNEVIKLSIQFYLVFDIVALVVVGLYLVVLPNYWEAQTVGRLITKTRVIGHRGDIKPGYQRSILRELVGTWFGYIVMYSIVSGFVIVVSAFVSLITGRSIVDYIGKTDLAMKDPLEVSEDAIKNTPKFDEDVPNQFKPSKDDFREDSIDAEVKDLDNENNDNSNDNNSDDEYHIF